MMCPHVHKGCPRNRPSGAVHKLFIDHDDPLVRKKRRKFTPEHLKVIDEEVAKFVKANVIR